MSPIVRRGALAAIVLVLAPGVDAHAFDMTGVWTGKVTCKNFDGVKFAEEVNPSTMRISHNGTSATMDLDNGTLHFNGHAVDDAKKPDAKGQVVFFECGTDNL